MAQDRVEAVERALTVLEAFDDDRESFTLADLAQATGYYKSTLLRLLGSLARFDYVQRSHDGRWSLGHAPLRLARRHPPSRHLSARIQPLLDRLAIETGETAALLENHGRQVECRLVALPNAALRHELRPGSQWPLAAGDDPRPELPGGKMLLQTLPSVPGEPKRWLTLSGPSSRLDAHSEAALRAAREELTTKYETEAVT
ncbi:helix-turn-helix domain-containing protein [Billgrantia pellis]|uniref:Helix-turn-helix domain-containing protein n=1 Tax=Billgrantia pellis TaxID=2606936 RepID=A0A7V7G280_9GAMM|nr:helix-turn-helix domain-containing protein [Halomonas pellis]KAA0013727.1 helix-turn-helix domain-containing protein [Halomonas pellis]